MKNIDIVFEYIKNNITTDYIKNNIDKAHAFGIDASDIQNNLNIVRNNASTLLNELHKMNKLIKINSRPVTFIPRCALESLLDSDFLNESYTLEELKNIIIPQNKISQRSNAFQHLLGSDNSLLNQVEQAKAAIMYPPHGLHTLILGESGVGKTTFASAMYEYGKTKRNLDENEFPFVSFNCSDYFNNPQLLLSQLFGYVKGAFTGADTDKIGLVEKANGGVLFLDEVHRLPSDGQEMLFYLMDKGEYHRLGETDKKRKSNVLIIAATTENPNGTLLSTFLRRIPVIITLPPFREKDISEKFEVIEKLFYYEALKLNMKISVSPEVLKALAVYDFKVGNIGQLSSEIKLLCAKSFLEHLQSNQELEIDFKMLSKEIREYIFNYSYKDNREKSYLDMFTENLLISPVEGEEYISEKFSTNIYEHINEKLEELKGLGLNKEEIDSEIITIIESYFKQVMNKVNHNKLSINQLYKILPKDIVDTAAELINTAQGSLDTKLNSKFIYGFAFHLDALLQRIHDNEPIKNPNMLKIKRDYPLEFKVAGSLVRRLSDKFGVLIPEDEKGFLAILLANNKLNAKSEDKVGIIVVCHGDSTASSMVSVSNALLNTDFVKAIDMPLDVSVPEIYNKVKTAALAINRGKGVLLLVDMGSLISMEKRLKDETGINVKTINNVSTLLVLEASRNALYKNDDLQSIYDSLVNKESSLAKENTSRQKAILTVCVTGQGAGMMAKKILSGILPDEYKSIIEIITLNYAECEKNIDAISEKYEILAYVGTFKADINIPYFPINRLLNANFQKEFLKFLDISINKTATPDTKSIYEVSKEMLEEYVKYINPKIAVINIKKFIDKLGNSFRNEQQDELINLIVHMGCMLDRCIHGYKVMFENSNEFKEKNINRFTQVQNAASVLEKEYDLKINDDEICYIVKILNEYN